jgi:hypothetical protein
MNKSKEECIESFVAKTRWKKTTRKTYIQMGGY